MGQAETHVQHELHITQVTHFLLYCCDLSMSLWDCLPQEAEVVALPRIIVKRWKDAGIDVLVNNAGMGRNDASLFDGNTASWVEMVSTNTLGVCMCTREAVQVGLPRSFCLPWLCKRGLQHYKG